MIKDKVVLAYNMSKEAHKGQMRKYSNQEYFIHPKSVARIVEDLTKDEDLIISALLHDTLEDTDITYDEILENFGKKVADIVVELTSDRPRDTKKSTYLIDKMNKMSTDALLIKLADRLHNVRYLDKDCKTREHLSFVKKYYLETIEILNGLNYRNKRKAIGILERGIQYQSDYLECKHKW